MARVTVEDCLKRIPNRFFLVHAAAKRVRQLREGSERLIDSPENEDIVTALREIAAGKVFVTRHYTEYEDPPVEENTPETAEESIDAAPVDSKEEAVDEPVDTQQESKGDSPEPEEDA